MMVILLKVAFDLVYTQKKEERRMMMMVPQRKDV